MQKNLSKVLSFVLALVMVLGLLPISALANEAQTASSELPTAITGLSIVYPYNTENIELTKAPVSRFDALSFESARNEVESAQMILTPDFQVNSFELTMDHLFNEKGNIIPASAFEVYTQHYVTVEGAGNYANYGQFETHDSWFLNKQYSDYLYHPRDGQSAPNGTYPNALIPQNAAIANGVNTIAAGQNGGIWVNLNVQDAAPGTYTGFATLTVNGEDMQIPVSVRIYDVEVPDEVHSILSTGIWWDQLEAGEGYVTQELADSYYNYLISKRISPWDRWNYWYTTDGLVTQVVSLASDPKVPAYLLYYKNDDREVNRDSVVATLTGVINKNIELAQSGSNVDLFKKAYFYFACVDEPAGGSSAPTYEQVQAAINVLDSVKSELATMLDAYPDLKQSFLGIKNIVTGPDPSNATEDPFYIDGSPDYSDSSALTSTYDSVLYCPQYQNMQTAEQRAKYADDTEVWWYGCCHPVAPYPTFHYNNPLVTSRALGFMMYEYGISGAVYSSVNYWGQYTDNGISLYDYWNGYSSGTPGDQMLVYPGSDFGVNGPIGSMRIETIRESSEDYEYLWLLEQFGGSISAYTAGLYDGTIVTGVYDGHTVDPDGDGNTDSDAIYHSRRTALLSKLEELNVAANGATEIEPGQENFVRGQVFKANQGLNIAFEDANYATVSFEYKLTSEGTMSVILRDPDNWTSKTYGDYTFNSTGLAYAYGNYQSGITCEILADGYVHVTMVLSELQRTGLADNRDAAPESIGVLDIYSWTSADGYIDNVQVSMEAPVPEETEPEVTEPEVTDPEVTEPEVTDPENTNRGESFKAGVGTNITFDNAAYDTVSFDYKLTGEGTMSVILRDPDNWTSKTYGDYTFNSTGLAYAYGNYQSGITCEVLEDGYVHVTMKLSELQRAGLADNRDAAPESIGVLDVYSWTTADGYIDNVQVSMEAPIPEETEPEVTEPEVTEPEDTNRGERFEAGVGTNIAFDNAAYSTISFDYKLIGEGTMSVILRDPDNWTSKTYGDYTFNSTGLVYAYGNYQSGITCEIMEDGYVHVTMKLSDLQRTGLSDNRDAAPESIGVLDIYSWTNVDGYIDNVQVVMPCEHSYEAVVTDPTFTANGYTTYSCSKCGDSYIADETTAYTVNVAEWNIALADDVRANFHLNIDSRIQDAFVTVLVNDFGYKYSVSELATTEKGYYIVSANVAAAQMTEDISIVISSGDISSEEMNYSIRQYAEYILNGEYDNNTKLLVQRMLNYGAAAQTYFDYNTENMANAGYEMTDVPQIPEATPGSVASGEVSGISYYGASLLYTTRIGVRFYFTVTGDINNYTFSTGKEVGYRNGMYYVDVLNINPNEYDDEIEVSVTDGVNTLRVGYSPLRYISRKYYGSTDTNLVNLVAQMYQYHMAAEAYLGEDQEVIRGEAFEGGVTKTIYLPQNATENLTFDYKLTTDGDIRVILRAPDWNGFYGDFTFDANGLVWSYQTGITTEKLEDGYIRVYVDFAQLNRSGCNDNLDSAPASVGVFDIYSWGTADGYIDNIQLDIASSEDEEPTEPEATEPETTEPEIPEEPVIRGEVYNAGEKTNYTIDEGNYATISFEYKLTTDGEINVMLRSPSDTPYYGGFKFDANGEVLDYAGVECEKLDDGYIRVTVTTADVERTNNTDNIDNIPATVSKICIYRDSTASGYIDNIQCVVAEETEMYLLLQKCNGTNATCSARDYSNVYFSTTPFTSSSDTLTLVVKTDYTSIKLRGMSNLGDEWSGSGVTKTLEDIGDGWKTVTWTLSEIVGSNDVTTMNGFRIDGLVEGTDILMKDILINGQTDWVGEFASNYHGVLTLQ